MKKKEKENNKFSTVFFIIEGALFLFTQFLGLFIGWRLFGIEEVRKIIEEQKISVLNFLISFSIGTALLLILIRFVKRGGLFKLIFYLLVFFGCLTFFDTFLPLYLTFIFTIAAILIRYFLPSVFTHNLVLIISIIGISTYLGLGLSIFQVLIILLILSVYDFIAVYKTGHMVEMFKKMALRGAMFSVIIPNKAKNLFARLAKAKPGDEFLFLGTGDLAFPIVFSVSSLKLGLFYSIFVVIGSFVGVVGINVYQILSKSSKAIAALPPIAGGAIFGFLVAWAIKNLF